MFVQGPITQEELTDLFGDRMPIAAAELLLGGGNPAKIRSQLRELASEGTQTTSVIDGHHIEFAKAVVALAREHRMSKIEITFEKSFHHHARTYNPSFHGSVQARWSEGRHLAPAKISLSAATSVVETIDTTMGPL